MQQRRERVRQQEHQPAADQPQHEKQTQRHAEDAPALVDAPERVRLGHEPRQRQRQTRRRHGQQHAVDIVGRLKRAHALFAEQVPQRNFIDRADELCDGDGPGQNGRAAEKAAPFSSGHRYPPFKFLMGKGRSPFPMRRISLRSMPCPTASDGAATLRSAQGIFRGVHAAAKYGFNLIRGLRAANSVRL